tara:strand:- start:1330 stop:1983 length:654 start_codon:yes stop_codon:yes gene_type:complete
MTLSVGNFSHNFCESKIFNDQPEIFNAISSLFITIIPFFYNFPRNVALRRVTFILMLNGIFSSYYHFNLNWFGKQLDELTMIFALYIGTIEIINIINSHDKKNYLLYDFFTITMTSINTLPNYDLIFPFMFFIGVLYLLFNIYILKQSLPIIDVTCLKCSFYGSIFWILSEIFCNRFFYFGHSLWHIMFPLGFIKFIEILDNAIIDSNIIKTSYILD